MLFLPNLIIPVNNDLYVLLVMTSLPTIYIFCKALIHLSLQIKENARHSSIRAASSTVNSSTPYSQVIIKYQRGISQFVRMRYISLIDLTPDMTTSLRDLIEKSSLSVYVNNVNCSLFGSWCNKKKSSRNDEISILWWFAAADIVIQMEKNAYWTWGAYSIAFEWWHMLIKLIYMWLCDTAMIVLYVSKHTYVHMHSVQSVLIKFS